MTPDLLISLACVCSAIAGVMAIGGRLLVDFSRRDLDIYCRRHILGKRFAAIMAAHDRAALAAENVKTIATALAILFAAGWLYESSPSGATQWLALGGVVFVSLFLLNWLPDSLVNLWSAPLLARTWPLWALLDALVSPLMVLGRPFDRFLRRAAGKGAQTDEDEEEAFEDEIRAIVTSGMREGWMEEDAREMIEGVIDLGDETAINIMTPRSEVDALNCRVQWNEMLSFLNEVRRTRVPVYQDSLDNIIGVLYVKDLLLEMADNPQEKRSLPDIVRDPWFVPGSIPLDDLLKEFLKNRRHLAVVVDEYNAVSGVVTIEDVLEEIVGEIMDESDLEEEPEEFRPVDSHVTDVAARAQIEDVNDRLGLAIPESDVYDTIGGFVITKLGYIPTNGEKIVENGYEIQVSEADRRRVLTVRVTKLDTQRESA